ncbi:MAG TPA: WD40 repeat domain-containing protein [Gemmataceae bacterium]|nr:WD40 repeat domain-containing protein [Gemmataceae bacterium]
MEVQPSDLTLSISAERLVAAVDRGEHSLRQLAQLFSVSLSFLVRLLQRRRRTGSVRPAAHGGGRCRALDVRSVSFSPDGRTLASMGADGVAKLWPVEPPDSARRDP